MDTRQQIFPKLWTTSLSQGCECTNLKKPPPPYGRGLKYKHIWIRSWVQCWSQEEINDIPNKNCLCKRNKKVLGMTSKVPVNSQFLQDYKISSQTPSPLNFQSQFFRGRGVRGITSSVHTHPQPYTQNKVLHFMFYLCCLSSHSDINVSKSLDFQWYFFRNVPLMPPSIFSLVKIVNLPELLMSYLKQQ